MHSTAFTVQMHTFTVQMHMKKLKYFYCEQFLTYDTSKTFQYFKEMRNDDWT